MSHRPADTTGAVIALITGLAVGAVLGVLFAPDSGKKTRERISDKALDLTDNVKDGYQSVKDRLHAGKDELRGFKDRMVDNVKNKANAVSEEFKEFRAEEAEKAKAGTKRTADDLNDDIQRI